VRRESPDADIFIGVSRGQVTIFFNGDQALCVEQRIEHCRVISEGNRLNKANLIAALKSL